jgi:hypothetical protein
VNDTTFITGGGKKKFYGSEGFQAMRPAGKWRLEAGWSVGN